MFKKREKNKLNQKLNNTKPTALEKANTKKFAPRLKKPNRAI